MKELEKIKEAVAFIQKATNTFKAENGIILGTGLGGLINEVVIEHTLDYACLLYTSPSPRDGATSRMPSSA